MHCSLLGEGDEADGVIQRGQLTLAPEQRSHSHLPAMIIPPSRPVQGAPAESPPALAWTLGVG
jgi:hypothetical protein